MKVRGIGEQGLLKILQRFCPSDVIGDDAAVLITEPEQSLVVTTDVLVDNVHFSEITTSPEDVGWRAVAANLSDLAAMGASPLGITVGLALPGDIEVDWVERLYCGMTECLQQYNASIVGGDLVRAPVITVSITAFGQAHPQNIIRRNTARVGDAIIVTGVHGASRAGLELLLYPEIGENINEADKQTLIKAHQRPQPRLDILPIRKDINFSQISGMDSSDGLADAVLQICRASNVGAVLEWQKIPVPKVFKNWLTPIQTLEYVLYGGEDFELVLCLPYLEAEILVQEFGRNAAIIGTITSNLNVVVHDDKKEIPDQVLTLDRGFQHFIVET
ncbi:thiamine-monophosphate kinase [Dulcicalothrix desertica PCC 7102]|uniref:Thiamine-monophosphate kinase n=1 Tax=Dulcicalothrix desertica PCC 7102 TaxID=232991 RepID=A0A433VKL6_9CYAN|nr:thiamine-phosphate kinase [Dulcicalothrix desertica]RUT06626.1 thiamine-monophosphate kinase [Dulcicalothrix desertica PCC 7102]TWH50264.1 thiamine-phosphate kinase [Dulcicalothrix desertica PCC 7102]